jgi:hypothetical protein
MANAYHQRILDLDSMSASWGGENGSIMMCSYGVEVLTRRDCPAMRVIQAAVPQKY